MNHEGHEGARRKYSRILTTRECLEGNFTDLLSVCGETERVCVQSECVSVSLDRVCRQTDSTFTETEGVCVETESVCAKIRCISMQTESAWRHARSVCWQTDPECMQAESNFVK